MHEGEGPKIPDRRDVLTGVGSAMVALPTFMAATSHKLEAVEFLKEATLRDIINGLQRHANVADIESGGYFLLHKSGKHIWAGIEGDMFAMGPRSKTILIEADKAERDEGWDTEDVEWVFLHNHCIKAMFEAPKAGHGQFFSVEFQKKYETKREVLLDKVVTGPGTGDLAMRMVKSKERGVSEIHIQVDPGGVWVYREALIDELPVAPTPIMGAGPAGFSRIGLDEIQRQRTEMAEASIDKPEDLPQAIDKYKNAVLREMKTLVEFIPFEPDRDVGTEAQELIADWRYKLKAEKK